MKIFDKHFVSKNEIQNVTDYNSILKSHLYEFEKYCYFIVIVSNKILHLK